MNALWSSVGNVTSVFTLLAFVVAAVVTVLRMRVNRDMKLVEAARVEDRPDLASRALERVAIDTSGLTEQQRFDLAMEQLRERRRRLSAVLGTAVALTIVLTVGFLRGSAVNPLDGQGKIIEQPKPPPEPPDPPPHEMTWRGYLGGVLEPFVLAGKADRPLVSAFASILRSRGDRNPEVQIKKWVEQAKVDAAKAQPGGKVADYAFLDLKLDEPLEELGVEDAFERLWVATSRKQSASDMAKVRLAMFELLGEQRQRELIDKWTR